MRDDALIRTGRRIAVALCVACLAPLAAGGARVLVAQEPQSAVAGAEQVRDWLRSAEQMLLEQRGGDAVGLFERALGEAQRLGLEAQRAQALCGIGEARFAQAQYPAAREAASSALEIYERLGTTAAAPDRPSIDRGIGRSAHILSLVSEQEGKIPAALQFAQRAVAAQDAAGNLRGRAVSTLQVVGMGQFDPSVEIPLYERAVADAHAASDPVLEARALHGLGDYLYARGAFVDSLTKLQAAATLFADTGRQDDLGTVYNSLGRLYRTHGQVQAALEYQLKALAIHEKSGTRFFHLQSLNAVAATYLRLDDFAGARAYYERALALAEQGSSTRIQDLLRAGLASVLIIQGDNQQAANILEGVIARQLDAYPEVRLRELAQAYRGLGRLQDALTAAQRALAQCTTRDELTCTPVLEVRARIYAALGQHDAALADLRTATTMLERARTRLVPADFFKQQFNLAQGNIYGLAIGLAIGAGRDAEALETAELARSRAFGDLLATRDLAPAPPAASQVKGTGETAPHSTDGAPLVWRGGSAAPGGTAAAPGQYLSSRASVPAASAGDLIAIARRLHSTLVAYWVGPDELFIWVVSANGKVRTSRVAVRTSTLQDLVRAATPLEESRNQPSTVRVAVPTRGGSEMSVPSTPRRAWRELYDLLIKPVRTALPTTPGALLTIVPHGPLGSVAFAGLQDERGRYLLEDYTLHYAPSGAVLQFTAAMRHPGSRQGRMLLVADPVPPALTSLDRPLPRLPGARAESRVIGGLIPSQRLTRLEGQAAAERAVRDAATGKAVLHFATHAIVRDDDPFASFLAVSAAGEDDGLLTAAEIYRLRLDADLVVLSACRSGGGRVIGDGVATFARAFIYAGVPSVVASLWDVADEPTNLLLPQFYRAWLGGRSKARALRAAQLRLLSELRAGKVHISTAAGVVSLPDHPVFWAGFALIGDPE